MAIEQIGGISNATVQAQPGSSTFSPAHAASVAGAAPVASAQAVAAVHPEPSLEQVKDATKKLNEAIKPFAQDLEFSVDQDTGRTVVKLMDSTTKAVLRQIPTEEVLEITKALDKLLKGMLVRQQA